MSDGTPGLVEAIVYLRDGSTLRSGPLAAAAVDAWLQREEHVVWRGNVRALGEQVEGYKLQPTTQLVLLP